MTAENYECIETDTGRLEIEISKRENHVIINVENTEIGDLKTIEIIDDNRNEVKIID